METATATARAAIGGPVPGYRRATVPVVRVESWGPVGIELSPIDAADVAADGWSAPPAYRLETPNQRAPLAVAVAVTGRRPTPWGGEYWLRGRLEICGDGEPSSFVPCWILTRWSQ